MTKTNAKNPRVPLAVAHRPTALREVFGQCHVVAVLQARLSAGSLPQQALFTGPSGTGKTTLARIVAATLRCCGEAYGAGPFWRHGPADVVELDVASHGGKDSIRELAVHTSLAPVEAPCKVFVIDEVHGLSGPGGQAVFEIPGGTLATRDVSGGRHRPGPDARHQPQRLGANRSRPAASR